MLDLGKIRDEIDATDDEIVRLFQHRMALTAEVAQYKIETGNTDVQNSVSPENTTFSYGK